MPLPISAPEAADSADRALDVGIVGIEDRHGIGRDDRPIAFLEIGDAARQRCECQGVRAEKHFTVAITDRKRATTAGANQEVVFTSKQKHESEGAVEPRQSLCHCILRGPSLFETMAR